MKDFRSSILCALVGFFVLSGMTIGAFDDCHLEKVESSQGGNVPSPEGGCHCLCLHGHPGVLCTTQLVVIFQAGLLEIMALSAEIPPESLPLGIDYPPQLA